MENYKALIFSQFFGVASEAAASNFSAGLSPEWLAEGVKRMTPAKSSDSDPSICRTSLEQFTFKGLQAKPVKG
jgi:hypothetical protein